MEDKRDIFKEQYKTAIDARDKLNDNYHKWMTFYYVANGAILVAITTLFSKQCSGKGIFLLSLIGVLICMIWNLSCKGYYYWSNNWINLIIDLEKKIYNEDNLVYGAFSEKIANNEKPSWFPLEPSNISTPKLTLIFSFISFLSWAVYSVYLFNVQFEGLAFLLKVVISILIVSAVIFIYIKIPKSVESRKGNQHKLK